MAKRSVSITTQTPTGTLDTTSLTDGTYPFCFQGGTSATTQRTAILEVYLGGQATASAPTYMILGRNSTAGSGSNSNGTGQNDAALDPATAALAAPVFTGNTWATTDPQRSSTLKLLNLSFNAFGGLVRWVAAPGEEIFIVGDGPTSATNSSISLSAASGGTPGALGAHAIYETQ